MICPLGFEDTRHSPGSARTPGLGWPAGPVPTARQQGLSSLPGTELHTGGDLTPATLYSAHHALGRIRNHIPGDPAGLGLSPVWLLPPERELSSTRAHGVIPN